MSKKTCIIYRWEKENTGPYARPDYIDSLLLSKMWDEHASSERHPGARADTDRFNSQLKCACPSRKALGTWFRGWYSTLRLAGYTMYALTVNIEAVVESKSGRQIFFYEHGVIERQEISL